MHFPQDLLLRRRVSPLGFFGAQRLPSNRIIRFRYLYLCFRNNSPCYKLVDSWSLTVTIGRTIYNLHRSTPRTFTSETGKYPWRRICANVLQDLKWSTTPIAGPGGRKKWTIIFIHTPRDFPFVWTVDLVRF